jgi:hypothetical protein
MANARDRVGQQLGGDPLHLFGVQAALEVQAADATIDTRQARAWMPRAPRPWHQFDAVGETQTPEVTGACRGRSWR